MLGAPKTSSCVGQIINPVAGMADGPTVFGLTKHFGQHHRDEMEVTIADLKVTYFDHLTGNYREERLLQLETDWIVRMETFGPTGLNTRNQLLSQQRRNWGPGY